MEDLVIHPDFPSFVSFRVQLVQTGSDYKPFIQTYGVPCLDIRYLYDEVHILYSVKRPIRSKFTSNISGRLQNLARSVLQCKANFSTNSRC